MDMIPTGMDIIDTDDLHDDLQPAFGPRHAIDAAAIGVVDRHRLSRDCFARGLAQAGGIGGPILSFESIEAAILSPDQRIDIILLHVHTDTEGETRAALAALEGTPLRLLVVSAEPVVDLSAFMSAALHGRVCGVVTSADTELRTLRAAIAFARSGGTFVPPLLLAYAQTAATVPDTRSASRLTPRQEAVIAKLREGKPNKIIAFELGMSQSTVKVHVRNIMRTLGATNRTQAVFRAGPPQAASVRGAASAASPRRSRRYAPDRYPPWG